MSITRRHFLKTCSAVSMGFLGLSQFSCGPKKSNGQSGLRAPGYGPLRPDPDGILDLPDGFTYKIISQPGDKMADGYFVPPMPDGMATFPGPNELTIVVRNHEINPGKKGAYGRKHELFKNIDPNKVYDAGQGKTPACGGTSTIVYDTQNQEIVTQYLSLAGSIRNCAGGPTPWNSWITCEETNDVPGKRNGIFIEKYHGFNFEVPASAKIQLADPIPLKAMGRFRHEAIAVDPETGIVYQTEDKDDGLLYRFIPNEPGKFIKGGKLQALRIADGRKDTRNWGDEQVKVLERLKVEWIDMEDVEAPEDDLRMRGYDKGAARFARGEGIWRGEDGVYFACTSGGQKEIGQIWRYIPSTFEGTRKEVNESGILELFIEPNDSELIKNADNLTIAPWGDLIVCEDRSGDVVRLVGITPQGRFYTFANHHKHTEFAGVCFSPDGTTLFVNMQLAGLTLVITGPFWKSA